MAKRLFYLFIVALPFEKVKVLSFNIGDFRVTTFEVLLALLLFFLLLNKSLTSMKLRKIGKRTILHLILLILASLFCLLYVERYSLNLKITLNMIENLFLLFCVLAVIKDTKTFENVIVAVLLAGFITAVMNGTSAILPGWIFAVEERGNPIYFGPITIGIRGVDRGLMVYGDIILMSIPLLLTNAIKSKKIRAIFGLVYLFTIVVFFSRSIWVSLFFEFTAFMFIYMILSEKANLKVAVIILVLGLLFVAVMYGTQIIDYLIGIRTITYTNRLDVFEVGLNRTLSDPVFIMFGAGKDDIMGYHQLDSVQHNVLVDIFTSNGAISLLLFLSLYLGLMLAVFKKARETFAMGRYQATKRTYVWLIVLAGILVHGMAAPVLNSRPLWVAITIACAAAGLEWGKERKPMLKAEKKQKVTKAC